MFENDVKTYGTQATTQEITLGNVFENDVKTYGTQAEVKKWVQKISLRMM